MTAPHLTVNCFIDAKLLTWEEDAYCNFVAATGSTVLFSLACGHRITRASTMVYPLYLGCICVAPHVLSFVGPFFFFLSAVACSGEGSKKKQQVFYY